MSYYVEETSVQSGSPVELYKLTLGSEEWYYASGEESVTYATHTYTPLPITRSQFPVGKGDRSEDVTLEMPATLPLAQKYLLFVPWNMATLRVYRYHRSDPTDVLKLFWGEISGVEFADNGTKVVLKVAPWSIRLKSQIPRHVYSNVCNHIFGDERCQVNLDGTDDGGKNIRFTGNVSAIDGKNLTVDGITLSGYPDQYFRSGYVQTAAGDRRLILSQISDNIKTLSPLFEQDDLISTNVVLTAGCEHSPTKCNSRYANLINYGGFPAVPGRNPFVTGIK